mgnify:CR=1 FL=1
MIHPVDSAMIALARAASRFVRAVRESRIEVSDFDEAEWKILSSAAAEYSAAVAAHNAAIDANCPDPSKR